MKVRATNRYERGLIWVIQRHGGGGVLESLEPGSSSALGSILEAESAAGPSRTTVDGRSRGRDREGLDGGVAATVAGLRTEPPSDRYIPEVCYSQGPGGIDVAVEAAVDSRRAFFAEFGAWLLGRVLQRSDRREAARWGLVLSIRQRRSLAEGYSDRRPLEEAEGRRIREVFERLGQHVDSVDEQLYRLGLFGVATATVRRFRQRLHRLADSLEARERDRCLHYYRRAWSSSRRSAGWAFRKTLAAFTEWYCAKGGGDVGQR